MSVIKLKSLDYGLDAIGLTYSIANIKEILGIIILVLSILSALYKLGVTIYTKIKTKKFNEISKEIENAKEELEEIKNNIKEEK